jgi:hypothetical protein
MDLSQIIVPAEAEQLAKPLVTCVIEGHLDEGDLRELALSAPVDEPLPEDDPSDLKKVREKHHSVARMIAGGLNQRMVSQLCGFTESYLSVLLNNPAMQELVQLYRIQQGAAVTVVTEKLRTVGLQAIEKLEEKLEAGTLNNQELLALSKLGLDRGGHGPQTKSHVVNETHLFDHAQLEERNRSALSRNAAHIVPTAEVRKSLAPPSEQIIEADRNLDKEAASLDEHSEPIVAADLQGVRNVELNIIVGLIGLCVIIFLGWLFLSKPKKLDSRLPSNYSSNPGTSDSRHLEVDQPIDSPMPLFSSPSSEPGLSSKSSSTGKTAETYKLIDEYLGIVRQRRRPRRRLAAPHHPMSPGLPVPPAQRPRRNRQSAKAGSKATRRR